MKVMKKIILISGILLANTASAGFLDSVSKVLDTTGNVLNTVTGTASMPTSKSTNSMQSGHPQPTTNQRSQLENKLNTVATTGQQAKALTEVVPLLQQFLQVVACSDEYGMRNIGKYTTLNATQNLYQFSGAMRNTQYHPKSQCMNVTQIGNVMMPALNALKLQVMFVSDASGESTSRTYLLMKQADGSWLVDKSDNYI